MHQTLLGKLTLSSLHDTDALGAAMNKHLPSQAVIALVGTLGAGKTRLVQSVAVAAGCDAASVTSPTFTLIQPYRLPRLTIYHIDTYRVGDLDEFLELGIEEILDEPSAWVFVEWAERMPEVFSNDTLWLRLDIQSDDAREITMLGDAGRWTSTVKQIIVDATT